MKFRDLLNESTSLEEAKFIYSDVEEKLKADGFYDGFLKLKKGLKKSHTIVMELDGNGKISSLEKMPKSEYKEFAKDKNWEEVMVRIYESSTIELKGVKISKEIQQYIDSYDWYYMMIDDSRQMKKAQQNNEWILSKLKEFGGTEFINHKLQMPSGTTKKVIKL